jgi:hypothetical protein
MLTEQEYKALQKLSEDANRNNDYSKMIMMGSPEAKAMKEYEQNNLCRHPDIGSDGGGDYCKSCGKRWER